MGEAGRLELRCLRRRICLTVSRSAGSRSATRFACSKRDGYIRKARAHRPVVVTNVSARGPIRLGVESIDDVVAMVGDARLHVRSWREEVCRRPRSRSSACRSDTGSALPEEHPRPQRTALRALDHLFSAGDRITPFARCVRRRRRLPGPAARTRRPLRRRPADGLGRTRPTPRMRRACVATRPALLVEPASLPRRRGQAGRGCLQPLARLRSAPVDRPETIAPGTLTRQARRVVITS